MKKIILIITALNILIIASAEKISSWQMNNSKGQTVITERYKDEPDGKYKLILIKENDKVIERTHYYKGNKEFKAKQIDILEDEYPKTVYIYYEKNNPNYKEFTEEVYYIYKGAIATTKYFENPEKYKEIKHYYNADSKIYQSEILFNRDEGKIKEVEYYVNSEVTKVKNLYKNDKTFIFKSITYFNPSKDNIKEKEEQYFDSQKEEPEWLGIDQPAYDKYKIGKYTTTHTEYSPNPFTDFKNTFYSYHYIVMGKGLNNVYSINFDPAGGYNYENTTLTIIK